jgi:hypothetical protein
MIKYFILLSFLLFNTSCFKDKAKLLTNEINFSIDSNYCKKIILMGETCLENYEDSIFYLLLNYDASHDTSLFIVIKNIGSNYVLKTSYFDPVENFNLYYYNEDGDSLKSIYTTISRKFDINAIYKIIELTNDRNFWNLPYLNLSDEEHFDGTKITLSISYNSKKNQIRRLLLPDSETTHLFNETLNYLDLSNFDANRYRK